MGGNILEQIPPDGRIQSREDIFQSIDIKALLNEQMAMQKKLSEQGINIVERCRNSALLSANLYHYLANRGQISPDESFGID